MAIEHRNRLATTNGNGAQPPAKQTVTNFIEQIKPELAKALPPAVAKVLTPERLARLAMTACRMNPKLAECDFKSLAGALMTAAQLGLEPNTPLGHCYLIPRKNRNTGLMEATFQLGYQGMVELASRSGRIQTQYAHAVYANDEFDYWYGLNPDLVHRPAPTNRGALVAVYAVAKYKDGGSNFVVLSTDEVESYRKRSMAKDAGPWISDYEAMARKTAFRQLFKWMPKSTELALAISSDDSLPKWDAMTGEVTHDHQVPVEANYFPPQEPEFNQQIEDEPETLTPAPVNPTVEPAKKRGPARRTVETAARPVETVQPEPVPEAPFEDTSLPGEAGPDAITPAAPAPAPANESVQMQSLAQPSQKAALAKQVEGWLKTAGAKFESDGYSDLVDTGALLNLIYQRLAQEGIVSGGSLLRHRQVMEIAALGESWEPIHQTLKYTAETIAKEMYSPN